MIPDMAHLFRPPTTHPDTARMLRLHALDLHRDGDQVLAERMLTRAEIVEGERRACAG